MPNRDLRFEIEEISSDPAACTDELAGEITDLMTHFGDRPQEPKPDMWLPGDPIPRQRLEPMFGDNDYRLAIARESATGQAIGLISMSTLRHPEFTRPETWLGSTIVDPSFRGMGVGDALMEEVAALSRELGANTRHTSNRQRSDRTHAILLYERHDYVERQQTGWYRQLF